MRSAAFLRTPPLLVLAIAALTSTSVASEFMRTPGRGRIMVFAPHPDDESLGCAAVISRALASGDRVKVVFLTCGDANVSSMTLYETNHPTDAYSRDGDADFDCLDLGIVRHDEAVDAMALLGVAEPDLVFLGYPDGGMMTIWNNPADYTSSQTGESSVPTCYAWAHNVGATYNKATVLQDVKDVLLAFDPTFVYTAISTDEHGDHAALFNFVDQARTDLGSALSSLEAQFSYLIHWEGHEAGFPHSTTEWTDPVGHAPYDAEVFLDDCGLLRTEKLTAIDAHVSQVDQSPTYLRGFAKTSELFWLDAIGSAGRAGAVWPLSDGKGLDARNWNDAAAVGAPGTAPGPVGFADALEFDGTSDCLAARPCPTLDMIGPLTIAFFVRLDGPTGSDQVVVAKGDATQDALNYAVVFEETAGALSLRFDTDDGGGLHSADWPGRAFDAATTWTHIALVVDTAAQEVHFYLDGALDATAPLAVASLPASAAGLAVGAAPSAASHDRFLDGALDEIHVLPEALTAAQVAALLDPTYGSSTSSGGGCTEHMHGSPAILAILFMAWGALFVRRHRHPKAG